MYLTAICDDDETELDKIEDMLNIYAGAHPRAELAVERYGSAESLLGAVCAGDCTPDIVLLDVCMPGMDGIEAARKLQDAVSGIRIVFLTASPDYALEAWQVNAAQYLVKPVLGERLFSVLDRILDDCVKEEQRYILLKADKKTVRVMIEDIVYCESQGKSQYIYLADGTQLCMHKTMTTLFERLSAFPEFVRAGASYIISLRHLERLNMREMQMDNGRTIHLPRGAYRQLREQYFEYYCEE